MKLYCIKLSYVKCRHIIIILYNTDIRQKHDTKVMVGAVLGSILGMAIIALLTTVAVCGFR